MTRRSVGCQHRLHWFFAAPRLPRLQARRRFSDSNLRMGLNYRFNPDDAARYRRRELGVTWGTIMKRKITSGLAIYALLVAAPLNIAGAADMPVKALPIAPAAPVSDWTGFYVGGNAGYGWSSQTDQISAIADPAAILGGVSGAATAVPLKTEGFVGGGQAGYNWQVSPAWLLGLEADLSSGNTSNTNAVPGTDTSRIMTAQEKLDWFGTVRGRIGVLPSDRFLAYVTGGLAYGHGSLSTALSRTSGCAGNICNAGSVSDTKAGWSLGGGVEWAFASNWSMKAEYLYVDLGSLSHNMIDPNFAAELYHASVPLRENIVRAGLNFRFN
jgi:outer membrane immunogenic protein